MSINGNFGNMPFHGNMHRFDMPSPYPRGIHYDCFTGYCPPKGGIIANPHRPVGADTINFFGKTGHDVINYHGAYHAKTYTMQSYVCPPGVYNMVDVNWCAPHYPQPIYHPLPIHGAKGCATC